MKTITKIILSAVFLGSFSIGLLSASAETTSNSINVQFVSSTQATHESGECQYGEFTIDFNVTPYRNDIWIKLNGDFENGGLSYRMSGQTVTGWESLAGTLESVSGGIVEPGTDGNNYLHIHSKQRAKLRLTATYTPYYTDYYKLNVFELKYNDTGPFSQNQVFDNFSLQSAIPLQINNCSSIRPHIYTATPSSAPEGSDVVLTGYNFDHTIQNAVYFNNTSIPFGTDYPNEYTFNVPNLPTGSYPVYVNSPNGGSNVINFQITTNATPYIESLDRTSGTIGDEVKVYGNFTHVGEQLLIDHLSTPFSYFYSDTTGRLSIKFTVPFSVGTRGNQRKLLPGPHSITVKDAQGHESNAVTFTIGSSNSQSSITVISPNGGETIQAGHTYTIRWNSVNNPDPFHKIAIALANYDPAELAAIGSSNLQQNINATNPYNPSDLNARYLTPLAANLDDLYADNGSAIWNVPANLPTGSHYYLDLTQHVVEGATDWPDAPFTINASVQPSITVTSPHEGDTWQIGSPQTVSWTTTNIPASNNIKISLQNYNTNYEILLTETLNDGNQQVSVPTGFPNGLAYVVLSTTVDGVTYNAYTNGRINITNSSSGGHLSANYVSSSAEVHYSSTNGYPQGEFGLTFDLSDTGGDSWVKLVSQPATPDINDGADYDIQDPFNNTVTSQGTSFSSLERISGGSLEGNYVHISSGQTARLRLNGIFQPWTTGNYRMILEYIDYNNTGAVHANNRLGIEDFHTYSINIPGTPANNQPPLLRASLDPASPTSQTFSTPQSNVTLAIVDLKADRLPVNNLNNIQIGSDSQNAAALLTNIKVFSGTTLLGTASNLDYNGTYYYQWIPVNGVSIPAKGTVKLKLTADIASNVTTSVRLGIPGLNFTPPGAQVTGTPIYGATMTLVPSGRIHPDYQSYF